MTLCVVQEVVESVYRCPKCADSRKIIADSCTLEMPHNPDRVVSYERCLLLNTICDKDREKTLMTSMMAGCRERSRPKSRCLGKIRETGVTVK